MQLIEINAEDELRGGEFVLAPLGDIQFLGDPTTITSELHEYIERVRVLGGFFLGMGDYVDLAAPSNRGKIRQANLYDNTEIALEDAAMQLVADLWGSYLEHTSNHWVGLLAGHHWYPLGPRGTTDTYLANMLGTVFLGDCAIVRLNFDGGYVDVWAHHGQGTGNPLAKLERVAQSWEADVFCMGHYTQLGHRVLNRIYMESTTKLRHRDIHLVATGGWSKAYIEGRERQGIPQGDYVEKALLVPAALGGAIIRIRPQRRNGQWSRRITVEL